MADEVLVTEFRLNDKYSAGVKSAGIATKDFIQSQFNLQNVMKVGAAGLAIGTSAVVAGSAALLGFANSASIAAASYDTMKRTFSGALGSIEAGTQAMAYLDDYATRSAFGLNDLAAAATQLAASGLDVGRFLPIMERFALVSSGVDPQGLVQVAGALARIKGGSFGEAMEVFRKAGVGANELRAQGISVSKAGEIQATADQVFTAIQKISEGRLKTIADSISGGAENIRANVSDVAGQAFRQVGDEVNKALLPALQAFTTDFKTIVDSGAIKIITQEFLGLIPAASGSSSILEEVAVAGAEIPHVLRTLGHGFEMLGDSIMFLIDLIPGVKMARYLIDQNGGGKGFKELFQETYSSGAGQRVRDAIDQARAKANQPAAPVEFPKPPETDQAKTATNTAKMVQLQQKQVDISRQILGGAGTVGGEAASPVRINQALGGGGSSKLNYHLQQVVHEILRQSSTQQMAIQVNSGVPNRYATR